MKTLPMRMLAAMISLTVLLTLTLYPEPAKAQPRRPDIGQMTREAESARPPARAPSQDSGLGSEAGPAGPAQPGGPTLLVKDFRLVDMDEIAEGEILAILEPYKGRELSLAQIQEAADRITALYRSRGFILARAYLPVQEAGSTGIVTIQMVIGRYGGVVLDNKSLLRDSTVKTTLDNRMPAGEPVRQKDLERGFFLLGDLSGSQVPRLNLSPGEAVGTSALLVEVEPERRVGGYLLADNHGSRYTGYYRFNAGLDIKSPLGIGDKISVYGLTSDTGHLSNAGLDYVIPIGHNGLKLSLGYGHVSYKLGKEFDFLEAEGESDIVTGSLTYPLIRSTKRNTWLTVKGAHKKLKDEINAFDYIEKRKISTFTFEVRHEEWFPISGKLFFAGLTAGITAGKLSFDDPDQAQFNRQGVDSVGNFSYLNAAVNGRVLLTSNWTLEGSAQFQKSLGRNLDSMEQFVVTGPSGVKAFRETVSGDNGFLLTAQLRYRLPELTEGFDHSLGFFLDHAGWKYEDASYLGTGVNHSDKMSDFGFVYSVFYEPFVFNIQVVRATGSWPDSVYQTGRTHIFANMGIFF
jgi:hemolysin activation/secretion protein